MCHHICNAVYHSGHEWQNYDFPDSVILHFSPSRSYSGTFRPFTVFLLEITVLRCTCSQVSPACYNCFSVTGKTKWSMTWVPICTGTISPYLWSEMTKNNTSSLYWDKSGIVRLASTNPLYDIKMPPSPQDATHPHHISQWKDPQPHFCTETLSKGRGFGTQYPPVLSSTPSTTSITSLAQSRNHTKG